MAIRKNNNEVAGAAGGAAPAAVSWSGVAPEDLRAAFVARCRREADGVVTLGPGAGHVTVSRNLPDGEHHGPLLVRTIALKSFERGVESVSVTGRHERSSSAGSYYLGEHRTAFEDMYATCSPTFRRSLAVALNRERGLVHPVEELAASLEGPERLHAMLCVISFAGPRQEADEDDFILFVDHPFGKGPDSLFREAVDSGRVDLDRCHLVDGRFCAFDTVHCVHPYVGDGTREYGIPGLCVADLRMGKVLTRTAVVGVGDDVTRVYAGRDAGIDGRRVSLMYRSFRQLVGDDKSALRMVSRVEHHYYPLFSLERGEDEGEDAYKRRFRREFRRLAADSPLSSKYVRTSFDMDSRYLAAVYDAVVFSDPELTRGLENGWDGGPPPPGSGSMAITVDWDEGRKGRKVQAETVVTVPDVGPGKERKEEPPRKKRPGPSL